MDSGHERTDPKPSSAALAAATTAAVIHAEVVEISTKHARPVSSVRANAGDEQTSAIPIARDGPSASTVASIRSTDIKDHATSVASIEPSPGQEAVSDHVSSENRSVSATSLSEVSSVNGNRPASAARSTSVNPPPAYVAAFGATSVVNDDQTLDWRGRNKLDLRFSDSALATINEFLDYILRSILANANATDLATLRAAIVTVLSTRMGNAAVQNADEELHDLLAGNTDEEESDQELFAADNRSERSAGWDADLIWRRTRLRVMVYMRLGTMEDEDEQRYVSEEQLAENNERRFSQATGLVSWAAAIFLTSVLEYVAEHVLRAAAQASVSRSARAETRSDEDRSSIDPIEIHDVDVEKTALIPALGRTWRVWRRSLRTPLELAPEDVQPSSESVAADGGPSLMNESIGDVRASPAQDVETLDIAEKGQAEVVETNHAESEFERERSSSLADSIYHSPLTETAHAPRDQTDARETGEAVSDAAYGNAAERLPRACPVPPLVHSSDTDVQGVNDRPAVELTDFVPLVTNTNAAPGVSVRSPSNILEMTNSQTVSSHVNTTKEGSTTEDLMRDNSVSQALGACNSAPRSLLPAFQERTTSPPEPRIADADRSGMASCSDETQSETVAQAVGEHRDTSIIENEPASSPDNNAPSMLPEAIVADGDQQDHQVQSTNVLMSASIRGPEDFDTFGNVQDMVSGAGPAELSVNLEADAPSPAELPGYNSPPDTPHVVSSTQRAMISRGRPRVNHSPDAGPVGRSTNQDQSHVMSVQRRSRSVPRPLSRNLSAHRRSGLLAREPRVQTESTLEFADFIRSTGPAEQAVKTPHALSGSRSFASLRDWRSSYPTASRRSSPDREQPRLRPDEVTDNLSQVTQSKSSLRPQSRSNMIPRSPRAETTRNSELIDFIRSGPATQGEHRISRNIAPFRSTMESEQLQELGNLVKTQQSREAMLNTNLVPFAANETRSSDAQHAQTDDENVSPIIDSSSVHVPATLTPVKHRPSKKILQSKDPYAMYYMDDDDDDDDNDNRIENEAVDDSDDREESLADFLRNSSPAHRTDPAVTTTTTTTTASRATTPKTYIPRAPSHAGLGADAGTPKSARLVTSSRTERDDFLQFLNDGPPVSPIEGAPAPVIGSTRPVSILKEGKKGQNGSLHEKKSTRKSRVFGWLK